MAVVVLYPPGIAELERRVNHLSKNMCDGIANDVRTDLADHVDTGALLASVWAASTRVWINTRHWQFIEYGTVPHIIRSHGPYPLRNRKTGQVFGRVVFHPGNAEYAPMRRALFTKRNEHGRAIGPSHFVGGNR
jgi:hypothetical protein